MRYYGIIILPTRNLTMAISNKKLWKLLIDKDMTAVELRERTGIAPNTMTKLRRD